MIVHYFTADWCPGCKSFKPIVQQVSQELGIQVNYVNVDYDTALTEKYTIRSIPTIIITDPSGGINFRHTGPMSPQKLNETFSRFR